ncbi:MAG: cytochrome c3 family protein [Phycisphaerales bacterium]
MKALTCIPALAVAMFVAMPALGQTMVGQAHDFSNFGWAEGEICKPCHTPHHAINDETGVAIGWLWNHELTTATYTLYDGSTADAGPDDGTAAFDKQSRLCMSCHDGTVAIDSFGGNTGSIFLGGHELIGIDLRDDHPVGITGIYPEQGTADFQAAVNHNLGPNQELKLREMNVGGVNDFVVGCTTCHTPHYKGFDHQLRMTNDSSALCLSCHIK